MIALGMYEGAAAPSSIIRSDDMCGARDRSLPRPVGDTGRRSIGNRKERHLAVTMRVPRKAASRFLYHFLAVRLGAQENDVNRCKYAQQTCIAYYSITVSSATMIVMLTTMDRELSALERPTSSLSSSVKPGIAEPMGAKARITST